MNDREFSSRVLIVDDDPLMRSTLSRLLKHDGYSPIVAASAEEALALAENENFSAVLTDIKMPGIGGVALLQRLSPMLPNSRFLVISGVEFNSDALPRGHRVAVFQKPFDEMALLRTLHEGIDARSVRPPPTSSQCRSLQVLLLEDSEADAQLFRTALKLTGENYAITHIETLAEAKQAAASQQFDVACVDLHLPDATGLNVIFQMQSTAPTLALVVLSGQDDKDFAFQAMQAGAQDYLIKGRAGGATIAKALRYSQERKQVELRVSEMAFYDPLTLLANRTLFRQRVARAASRAQADNGKFAVLLLDMDRFKAINDGLGHDAGDAFLQEVGHRLKRVTRKSDIAARLGGDEFAVVVQPVESRKQLQSLCERILQELRQPFALNGVEVVSSASIGAATYPESGRDSDSLLTAADAAMYAAKSAGRDKVYFHGAELTSEISDRMKLEQKLRRAVAQEEFSLYFQPLVDQDGRWVSAEVLLRWTPPNEEPVPAYRFVPMLEETGLICELGPWILMAACKQLREWMDRGYEVRRLAVNVSARQFTDGRLVEDVRKAVADAGIENQALEIELTETALMKNTDAVATQLRELATDGFRIALDDFGTGYSSLTHLREFPISTVKIDRSFVKDISTSRSAENVVGGIIHLARRLDLDVVAEGVESGVEAGILQSESCSYMQGYYFSRPLSASDFEDELLVRLEAERTESSSERLIQRASGE